MDNVVLEYQLADGTTAPAIVAAHPHTAGLLTVIFQLLEFAPRAKNKEDLLDKICMVYREIIDKPVGDKVGLPHD